MKVYNLIPVEVKPPHRPVQLQYTESLDNNFSLLLREIRSTNIDTIMRNTINVKVSMMASGKIKQIFNKGDKKPQGYAHPWMSQYSEAKFELMMKVMDKLME
jgi:hypothetical protein